MLTVFVKEILLHR